MSNGRELALPDTDSDTQQIAESIIPYLPDDSNKAKYLSYRACGFAQREALKLTGVTQRTLDRWRAADDQFKEWDQKRLRELRDQLGNEFIELHFRRNYRLILQKDFNVINKSVQEPEAMTKDEERYLNKARAHYTPQQLEVLERILGKSGDGEQPFNFTKFLLSLQRGAEKVELQGVQMSGQLTGGNND